MEKVYSRIGKIMLLATFASVLILAGCPTNEKGGTEPLAIKDGENGLEVNLTQKELTVTFNKKITEFDTSKIKVYTTDLKGARKSELSTEDISAVGIDADGKLIITLKDNLDATKKYYVELDKGAVKADSESLAEKKETENDGVLETPTVSEGSSNTELKLTFTKETIAEDFAFDKAKITSTIPITGAEFDAARKVLTITFNEAIPSTGIELTFAQAAFSATSESFTVEYDKAGPAWNKIVPVLDKDTQTFLVGFGEKIYLTAGATYKLERTPSGKTKEIVAIQDYRALVDTDGSSLKFTITNVAKVALGDTFMLTINPNSVQDSRSNKNIDTIPISDIKVKDLLAPKLSGATTILLDKLITVSFNEDITKLDNNRVEIRSKATSGGSYSETALASSKITTIVVDSADKKLVRITLKDSPTIGHLYQVKFLANALTDPFGNVNEEEISTEATAASSTVPRLGGTGNDGDPILDKEAKTITTTLNKAITSIDDTKIKIDRKTSGGAYTGATTTGITSVVLNSAKNKVVVTLNALNDGESIRVVFEAGALTDAAGDTNVRLQSGEVAVGDIAPPTLLGSGNPVLDKVARTITVTLNEAVNSIDDTKIKINRKTSGGAYAGATTTGITSVALNANKNKVIVTLASLNDSETIRVIFEADALTDAAGNSNTENSQSGEISIGDITPPALGGSGNDGDLVLDKGAKTITVILSEAVNSINDTKIKINRKASGGTYLGATTAGRTVALYSAKNKVIITLGALDNNETIKVVFEAGALTDAAGNSNTGLESDINVGDVIPPGLGGNGNDGDPVLADISNEGVVSITVTLSENLKSIDGSKIKVERKPSGGTYAAVTVLSSALNSAKNKVIVKVKPLVSNDKVKVVFEVGTLTDTADITNKVKLTTSESFTYTDGLAPVIETVGVTRISGTKYKFTATFNENISMSSADRAKVTIPKLSAYSATILSTASSGKTFSITFSGLGTSFSVYISFPAGTVEDAQGNEIGKLNTKQVRVN